VAEVPEPASKSGAVLVRNVASLISAGTEKMVIDFAGKSLIQKAQDRPDLVKQVMDKVRKDGFIPTVQTVLSRLGQPIPLGYSCAGIVETVGRGAEEFAVGDRVACAGMGAASHAHAVVVPKNLTVPIPDAVSFEDASYVTLGAIALQGVRIADIRLGDRVAVIGLGLLGQLTVQILRSSGARVIGIDLDPAKVALAIELGAETAVARAEDVKGAVGTFTGGVGVDAVIIAAATDSNDPIELAGDISRDRGHVVMVGAVKMDIPRKVYYEKELDLRLSRSYGPGRYDPEYEERGRDYPIGYVRWTERRNMEEFLRLVAAGHVSPHRLTTHRFGIERAEEAYEIVTGKRSEPFAGIVLTYETPSSPSTARSVSLADRPRKSGSVGIGFIGAGNFAQSVLLPRFARETKVDLVAVATGKGVTATTVGEKFKFRVATTDHTQLLTDDSIDAVVVATRHGSHARFASEALRAGKGVFLEKPLAIHEEGMSQVLAAQKESGQPLTVGFNRRFSSHARVVRDAFANAGPLAIQYRINAGPIPRESWIHDPEEGGGRIIGEVCHFIDLIQFITGDLPVEVFAHALGGSEGALHDTVTMSLKLSRGSVASIAYLSTGDRSVAKERLEVFGGGAIGILDDFRETVVHRNGRSTRHRTRGQEKGFDEEIRAFVAAVSGGALPISLESLEATTRATFAAELSLRTGGPAPVTP
jgi:predicted dehydrogenase